MAGKTFLAAARERAKDAPGEVDAPLLPPMALAEAIAAAFADRERLLALVDKLAAVVRSVEAKGAPFGRRRTCPLCEGWAEVAMGRGSRRIVHAPNCALAAALAELEKEDGDGGE